jgi:uncharacterized membrane protein
MTTTTGERLLTDYLARLDGAALSLPEDRRADLLEGIAEHVAAARAAGELQDEAAVRTLLDRLGEPEEIVAAARDEGPDSPAGDTWGPPRGNPPPWTAAPPATVATAPSTGLETAAVLMLTVGSLLPVVGWLVGVALLWTSRRWRVGEKLLGTLIVPGGPGILLPLSFFTGSRGECVVSVAPIELSPPGQLPPPLPSGPGTFPPPPPGDTTVQTFESCSTAVVPFPVAIALLVLAIVGPVLVAVFLLRRARARAAAEPPVQRPVGGSAWGGLEIAAVVVLAAGPFVVPVVGSVVGLVLVWLSTRWSTREKAIATTLVLIPAVLLVLLFALPLVGPGFGVL